MFKSVIVSYTTCRLDSQFSFLFGIMLSVLGLKRVSISPVESFDTEFRAVCSDTQVNNYKDK